MQRSSLSRLWMNCARQKIYHSFVGASPGSLSQKPLARNTRKHQPHCISCRPSHEDSEVRYENPSWGKLTADFAESLEGWVAIDTHSGDGAGPQIGRRLISDSVAGRWRDYYDAHANPVLHRKRGT